jgi:hypothetical protein
MKRHIDSMLFYKETQWFNVIHFLEDYKQKCMVKGECLFELTQKIKTKVESKEEFDT